MNLKRTPPRTPLSLLARVLPGSLLSSILGDLEEEWRENAVSSPSRARLWLWTQSFSIAIRFATDRVRRRFAPGGRDQEKVISILSEKKLKGDALMRNLWQDARYGLRLLAKSPGFTALAVLTLALGVGANTAIFSVVNQVLLHPLPYDHPETIVTLWENNLKDGIPRDDVSPANFLDWRERNDVFSDLAFSNPWSMDYTGGAEPETFHSALVSEGFFRILGARATLGRTFLPEEFQDGKNKVLVISYGLWQRKFGGDHSILNKAVLLDGESYTVVGILSPEFRLQLHMPERELFSPQILPDYFRQQRRATYLKVLACLKPGVTPAQAQSAMDSIAMQLAKEYPQTNSGVGVTVVPLEEHLVAKVRPALLILLAAAGFVLLIACANVANLLLARGGQRERELAIRSALGAGRNRLVRQLMTESILLAFLGAALGLLLANWGVTTLVRLGPADFPRLDLVRLDSTALLFALVVASLTALVFGLIPSLKIAGAGLGDPLKESGRGATSGVARQRTRSVLVVAEVALALMLLVGAGLFLRSFLTLIHVDPGFQADRIVALQAFLWERYNTPDQRANYVRQGLEKLASVHGVEAAAVTTALPFLDSSQDSSVPITVEGQAPPPPGQEPTAFYTVVTPDYFPVMGIPLLQGRDFNEFDTSGSPLVAIVTESVAQRFWPNESPIGKKMTPQFRNSRDSNRNAPVFEIVGVVGSVRHEGLHTTPRPEFFIPYARSLTGSTIFVVRTALPAETLIPALKSALWEINNAQPFYAVSTVDQLISNSLTDERFSLVLLGSFASLALILAAVGIYGVMSFATSQRTHEIGVRVALGAQSHNILRMVLAHGMKLALAGILIGTAAALVLARFLRSLLFGITPADPLTYLGISALLLAVALLACYLPARRATRVDPIDALRYE